MVSRSRSRPADGVLWALSGALFVTVVYLSLAPRPLAPGPASVDKLEHVLAYAALTGSLLLAAVWRPGRGDGAMSSGAPAVAGGVLALGIVLELMQAYGPISGRNGDPLDAVADAAGVALAMIVWNALRARARPS